MKDSEPTKLNTTLTQDPQCVSGTLNSLTTGVLGIVTGKFKELLDLITYVGVGISLASLVICLIIEGYVWKAITKNSTAFMRHVSIINTALSLLIADICFIIGAIADNPAENPGRETLMFQLTCSTATFFMHFFTLRPSAILPDSHGLLPHVQVSHVGYWLLIRLRVPSDIAVVTVAVTAPGKDTSGKRGFLYQHNYRNRGPFKMLRRGVGDGPKRGKAYAGGHSKVCGHFDSFIWTDLVFRSGDHARFENRGLHIVFALFNSLQVFATIKNNNLFLHSSIFINTYFCHFFDVKEICVLFHFPQGFFILVFGTLFDSKIRSILAGKSPTTSTGSNTTRSTSGGISSTGLNWFHRLHVYRVSETANSGSAGASESFSNI
ncbi:hypothetical protein F7725_019199 [Dissostichus mawsoni]|uniref:Uncharacterized protein n=1 Tax=Dissostichus mawsoni TaxID=36200 RepID=A0A7J5YJE6_DISMA|nr:hypothetical protein F7725_019199 [Dissostichus mawsoni]